MTCGGTDTFEIRQQTCLTVDASDDCEGDQPIEQRECGRTLCPCNLIYLTM